jgi:CheY-like chemotaxis protein
MKISVSKSNDQAYGFKPVQIKNIETLVDCITKHNWSCGIFKQGHRQNANFISADCIALDIDDGMTIAEAEQILKDYEYVISPTRNHNKEKNGKIAERFRIIIPFTRTVTDPMEYYGTWDKLKEILPALDPQCPDPARLWYPGQDIQIRVNEGKKRIEPVRREQKILEAVETKRGTIGQPSQSTLDFIFNGAAQGTWNGRLYEAALDLRCQGYSHQEVLNTLMLATRKELGNDGELDIKDLSTIESAFSAETRYEKRGAEDCFELESVGKIIKEKREVKWIVDNLLGEATISVIAGPPKSGKSTIIRQLSRDVAQGGEFLGRKVKQGTVIYLALEEQRELLAQQLRQLGVKDEDPFYLHVGPVAAEDKYKALENLLIAQKPTLVVIDTMILFAGTKDINSYTEMYEVLSKFRNIARKTRSHIMFVHHQNKGEDRGTASIMGSSAIHGSVDIAILFNKLKHTRYISTSQRGGIPFNNTPLEFDPLTQTYTLGTPEDFS